MVVRKFTVGRLQTQFNVKAKSAAVTTEGPQKEGDLILLQKTIVPYHKMLNRGFSGLFVSSIMYITLCHSIP